MKAFLAKAFGARDKLSRRRGVAGDKEMPFLEHLEELRQTLVKIIVTLIIVTIGAFVFRVPLMEAIKRPVELAGLGATIELPAGVSKREWRKVETLAKTARSLDGQTREAFLRQAMDEEEKRLEPYVRGLPIFNATLVLGREVREEFVREAVPDDAALRETVLSLVRLNPKAKVDRQGNLIQMSALRPPEAFMLSLKISMMAGVIVAFPLLLYFVAQFVFPGLTLQEKKAVIPAVGVGFALFLMGASFAYWVVTPRVLEFFHGYADELGVDSDWRFGYYVSFVSQLVLIFGLSFELPVVVLTLVKIDLLGYAFMARNRSYAIVIIFTVAAIVTPTPDAPTLCLLAVPMVILYEICIWMAYFIDRRRRRAEAEEEAELALRREKRAQGREVPLPVTLPTGTVGRPGSGSRAGGDGPAAGPTDESAQKAFEENDALREDEDGAGLDSVEGESSTRTDHEEYESGFEPRAEDEAPDPFSDEDFHNAPYREDTGHPRGVDHPEGVEPEESEGPAGSGEPEPSQGVDETSSQAQEGDDESPSKGPPKGGDGEEPSPSRDT